MSSATQRPSRAQGSSWLWLLLPILTGATARLWNLRYQIVGGDELHSLRPVLLWDLRKILTTFPVVDDSIPLAALLRLVSDAGVPLTESVVKLPSVVAGIALLCLAAWALRCSPDGGRSVLLTWLLALSPALIFYSRIFRPYAVTVLLATLSLLSFWRWWRQGSRRWAAAYAVAASGAIWFHLIAAPFVLAPLAFGTVASLGRRSPATTRSRRGAVSVLAVSALVAALTAAMVGPALPSLRRMLADKVAGGSVELGTVAEALRLLGGSAHGSFVVLLGLVAAAGLWRLGRRDRELGLYSSTAVAAQWLAVIVVRPHLVQDPIVFGRYLLVTLPVVLLWTAEGLVLVAETVSDAAGRGLGRWPGRAVVAAFFLVLVAAHPYVADPHLRLGSFAGSNAAIHFSDAAPALDADEVPAAYRIIAADPGEAPVLEAPSSTAWWQTAGELAASGFHGRPVLLGGVEPWLWNPRLALRTLLPATPGAFLQSGARFVVVNLDRGELLRRARRGGGPRRARRRGLPLLQGEAVALAQRLRAEWGEPQWADGSILVWDLTLLPPQRVPALRAAMSPQALWW